MSAIGSLNGSPQTTTNSSKLSTTSDTSAPSKEKVKEKETAPQPTAPPPEPARLQPATGYNLVRAVQETAEPEAEPAPETRRAEDAERRLASDEQVEDEHPAERERFDRAPAEKDEARRDDLFQQRAAARGVNLYQTSLEPREEAGLELNARF